MLSSSEQLKRTYAMGLLIGGVFLVCGLLLLRQLSSQNERENALYLYDTVNQLQTLVQRQIALDFQTLYGLAVSLGHMSEKEILPTLKEVNDNNAFLRMGLAGRDGRVDLVDISGELRRGVDMSGEAFFQEALAGRAALSGVRGNPFGPGSVIYCAVPVHDRAGGISGVLMAVNSADVFLDILRISLFDNKGLASLIDGQGVYVLRPAAGGVAEGREKDIFDLGPLENMTRERVLENLQKNRRDVFFYTAGGKKHFAAYEPLGVNNWFLFCTVPAAALSLTSNALWLSVCAIIGLALLLAFFLLWRVRSISNQYHGELERMAFLDPLTGIRNINRLKMDAAVLTRRNPDLVFAVWYADIKNFKFYNEMFGYEMGDKELVRIAALLAADDGPLVRCCRVSADKFAGIRPMSSREEFTRDFQALRKRIEDDTTRFSRAFPLALHVGVYSTDMAHAGEVSFMDMINRANIALRVAKEGSADACVFYSDDMRGLALRQLEIESRMEAALRDDQFKLYFQPKVDIQNGNRIQGAEVLTRWHDDDRPVPPRDFIPLFERNGFIIQLDRHIFSRACAWLHQRLKEGKSALGLAVNVSRLSLIQDDFLLYYSNVKERYGIPDGLLELECTESLALFDDHFREMVLELKKRGFRCSLDDFGAGFSSFNVLKDLPIDVLKLDMLFLRKSRDLARERIVVSNIIAMARELGVRTVAEGVEHAEEVDFLRSRGCNMVQGYVFARPMSEAEFNALLDEARDGVLPLAQAEPA
ncbi:EAL domain-containing protein [uncultured Desulfovibrio sp.]|uniref:putative bifunctional diguanylate cyclase/phosphodiesterase n=1 Tax=uncultured Desulfovibrio sp. TaxID=167968 RepID=UPI00262CF3BA|nr:EAL domain-containing protein [uncultured Desulfovibrio sp.]